VRRCTWEAKEKAYHRQRLGFEEVYHFYQGNLQDILERNLLEGLGPAQNFIL
jgi:hypothetical protein